ncbi:MAG: nitrite reductase (NAD(P)H) small subunit [Acidimicrobiales bacterium]|nr:nitrite reductase (NAD(P)H) small subunit [Acidimicrobiales bacterium]
MAQEEVEAGRVEDFPEDSGRLVDAGGRLVAVFRSAGVFYAVDRTCPHAGGPLEEGFVDEGIVLCPIHAYTFDLETGRCLEHTSLAVDCFPVRVEDDIVFVSRRPRA